MMNEHIRELVNETIKQSLTEHSESTINVCMESDTGVIVASKIPLEFVEKFAELVVKDCMNRISKWNTFITEADKIQYSNIADDINKDLCEHFGIK